MKYIIEGGNFIVRLRIYVDLMDWRRHHRDPTQIYSAILMVRCIGTGSCAVMLSPEPYQAKLYSLLVKAIAMAKN